MKINLAKNPTLHGPALPSGWGDLYNRNGYRRGRVHVSHVPETLRYPHVVIIGANDYPLRELAFGETAVLGDRHATVSNGVWSVIMDAAIPE